MIDNPAMTARRLTRTILVGVALGSTSLFAAFTASVLVATDLGASRAWAGVPGAASILGTAFGAAFLARLMAIRGRRAGLVLGWTIGLIGSLVAVLVVTSESFVGLIIAMTIIGIGHASNQLSRFAAADMHPGSRRATIVGFAVWAGTVGAVVGPSALGPGEAVARAVGLSPTTSGFLVATLFFAGALACGLRLHPDPSSLSEEEIEVDFAPLSLSERWRLTQVRIAVIVLLTSQLAMTAIMTMTPLHIREHGHGVGVVGLVMSAHFVGMFAFAPLVGAVVARFGSARVAVAGLSVLIVAALAAAIAPEETPIWISGSLFLLGLGWCLGFIAGSALLTGGLAYSERVRLQGSIDALTWTASALASLTSGILFATFGYVTLALVGAIAVVGPLAIVAFGGRRLAGALAG